MGGIGDPVAPPASVRDRPFLRDLPTRRRQPWQRPANHAEEMPDDEPEEEQPGHAVDDLA